MSQLDDILTDLSKLQAERQVRVDPDQFTVDVLAVNNAKENIQDLMLEIFREAQSQSHGCDSEVGWVMAFEEKVKEL